MPASNAPQYSWWAAALVALAGGGAAQLISVIVNYITKKKQIEVSDEASLRKSLMEERKQLNCEINDLNKRLDKMEEANHLLRESMLVMEKTHYEKERDMQYEIDTLKKKVKELETELSEYKKAK